MLYMKILKYLLLLLAVFMTACMPPVLEQATVTPDSNPADLADTEWYLESFGEPGTESPVVEGSTITLKFEGNGQAAGQSGCNSYGGSYTIQPGALRFEEVTSTLVACEDQVVNDQEEEYLKALRAAGRFNVSDDRLVIWYENNGRVLNFARASGATPAPLPTTSLVPTVGALPGSNQERVVFEAGATSVTRSGNLSDGETREYVLSAAAGQRMHIQTVGYKAPVQFTLSGPDGQAWSGKEGASDVYIFTQEVFLPEDGDYVVKVSVPPEKQSTRFDIVFTVDDNPAPVDPPERVELNSGIGTVQRNGLLPSGPGMKEYLISATAGQTMTITIVSDDVPLSLVIATPSGVKRIPETSPAEGAYQISHSFTLAETGDYLVTISKADHTPSTNYTIDFVIQ
jgi:heat shock protein HslJ